MQSKNFKIIKGENLRQEHQMEVLYVSFNAWDSQVSSYTPFNSSFTVPLTTQTCNVINLA